MPCHLLSWLWTFLYCFFFFFFAILILLQSYFLSVHWGEWNVWGTITEKTQSPCRTSSGLVWSSTRPLRSFLCFLVFAALHELHVDVLDWSFSSMITIAWSYSQYMRRSKMWRRLFLTFAWTSSPCSWHLLSEVETGPELCHSFRYQWKPLLFC